jgi:hypothetical protein
MAKNSVEEWDTNPDGNTDVGNNNIAEGCPPGGINNAIRMMMAQIRVFFGQVARLNAANVFTSSQGIGPNSLPTGFLNDGKSLAIGDGDTGLRQGGENVLEFWTGNVIRTSLSGGAVNFYVDSFRINNVDLVYNNGGTYNINIGGGAAGAAVATNAFNLGGIPAASYITSSSIRPAFADIGVDEVGSLAVLSRTVGGLITPGETSLGSNLRYSNFDGTNLSGIAPNGTWMALSRVSGSSGINSVGLFKRIS